MNGLELLSKHKLQITEIAKENGIFNVRVFGSVVKNEEHAESDIDLLVSIEDGRTLFDLIRFKQSVEQLLKRKVDVLSDQAVHEVLKERITEEAVQL